MPKRIHITVDQIAEWDNLLASAYLAGKGKRSHPAVQHFFAKLDANINRLSQQIRDETIELHGYQEFEIHDPKRRIIHAPSFRDRVLHQAIIRSSGEWIDRLLIDDSFACRVGKGSIAAVFRAQHFSRRFDWYAKVDIRKYFPSIDQTILLERLARRFKQPGFLNLLEKVIRSFPGNQGCGLPIGALTSQYFANLYLNDADRWLIGLPAVRGLVRYMDDTVCWFETKAAAKTTVAELESFLHAQLRLELSPKTQINRVNHGLTFCGYRIFPGTIKLTKRRQHLYLRCARKWESKFLRGEISPIKLQSGYASAFSISKHADAVTWRRDRRNQGFVDEA